PPRTPQRPHHRHHRRSRLLAILADRVFSWGQEAIIAFGGHEYALVTSLIFPVIGRLTGLWQKAAISRCHGARYKLRVKAITAVMVMITGAILACKECYSTFRFDRIELKIIQFSVAVVVFLLAGWILGAVSMACRGDKYFRVEMSVIATFALFASALA
ncbi:hypothetical protein, partial [Cutibacterium avidum]|uniref:hypothetical protein n=1 Tax=Cutibacterium avidum TaxID=33010 RepID=UPI002FF24208